MNSLILIFISYILIIFSVIGAQSVPENCKNVSVKADKRGCTLGQNLHVLFLLDGPDEADAHFRLLQRILEPCIEAERGSVWSTLIMGSMKNGNRSVAISFDKLTRENFQYVDMREYTQEEFESLLLQVLLDYYLSANPFPVLYTVTNYACDSYRLNYPQMYSDISYLNSLNEAIIANRLLVKYLWTKPGLLGGPEEGPLSICGMDYLRRQSHGLFDYEVGDLLKDEDIGSRYGLCGPNGRLSCKKTSNMLIRLANTVTPYLGTNTQPTTSTSGGGGGPNLFQIIGIIVVTLVLIIIVFLIVRRIFFPNWTPRFLRRWLANFTVSLLGKAGVAAPVIQEVQTTLKQNNYQCVDEPTPLNLGGVSMRRSADVNEYDYPKMTPIKNEDLWEIQPLSLQISNEKLGSGAYAVVFSGKLRGPPPVTRVFPTMQLSYILSSEENEVAVKLSHTNAKQEELQEFIQEIEFMKKLEYCPHLLSMLGCSTDPKYPVLITELCEKGDLLHLVRDIENERIDELEKLKFNDLLPLVWQVSDGLAYLTSRKIIHRDVAARNVLITSANMAKLSDFGLCRYNDQMFYTTRGGKLPIKWMAPESLEFAIFSAKTDVWSFGVLLWEVYTYGKTPYTSVQPDEMLKHLRDGGRLEIPERTPDWMKPLINGCWEDKADDRPCIDTLQQSFYSMMEADAGTYGYLQFSQHYYKVSPPNPSSLPNTRQSAKPNEYVIS